MTGELLPLGGVRFIEIRGEPGCGAWINGSEATPLHAYGALEALDDAVHAWHTRWFWDAWKPEGEAQMLSDAEGLALAHAVKAWVGTSVEVHFVPIVGPQVVIDDPH